MYKHIKNIACHLFQEFTDNLKLIHRPISPQFRVTYYPKLTGSLSETENPHPLGLYSVPFHMYTYNWVIKVEKEPQIYDHMLKIIKELMSNCLKL